MSTHQSAYCLEVQESLSAYVDGEVTKSEKNILEGHFTECSACREKLAEFSRLVSLVASLPEVQADAAYVSEVRAKLAKQPSILEKVSRLMSQHTAISGLSLSLASVLCFVVVNDLYQDGRASALHRYDDTAKSVNVASRPTPPRRLATRTAAPLEVSPKAMRADLPATLMTGSPGMGLPVQSMTVAAPHPGVLSAHVESSTREVTEESVRAKGHRVPILNGSGLPLPISSPPTNLAAVEPAPGETVETGATGPSGAPDLHEADAKAVEHRRSRDLNEYFGTSGRQRPRQVAGIRGPVPAARVWVPDDAAVSVHGEGSLRADRGLSDRAPIEPTADRSPSGEPMGLVTAERIRPFLPKGVEVANGTSDATAAGEIQVFVNSLPAFLRQLSSLVTNVSGMSYQRVNAEMGSVEVLLQHTGDPARFDEVFGQIKDGVNVLPTVRSSGASSTAAGTGQQVRVIRIRVRF